MLYLIATRYLFDPLAWVLYAMIAAVIAGQVFHNTELQKGLIVLATVALFALMIVPFDQYLARPLEDRYPRPALPAHVDGIVVLDGGMNPRVFLTRGVTGENPSVMRMLAGAELARRYPQAKFIFSGNTGHTPAQKEAEHQTAQALFAAMGVPAGRTLYEITSRDTGENLINSRKLANAKDGETWVLVTSAVHMPRAMAIARRIGWTMIPWPSDYISAAQGGGIRIAYPSDGLLDMDRAIHEWVGEAAYRLSGRAD
ncbi:MAG TPA: YdcF family protein [Rhizomicrobium sp.]|jgi:uncharacterized SAM-binding protein YcdF (DUF218 family)|nr:YdcF family protein [Rhizomicrobium sp.]